jgi:hypothetical protein
MIGGVETICEHCPNQAVWTSLETLSPGFTLDLNHCA